MTQAAKAIHVNNDRHKMANKAAGYQSAQTCSCLEISSAGYAVDPVAEMGH